MGAGPAGAALALLLASRGVSVTLIERQHDFEREFRGELMMPSGLVVLDALGVDLAKAGVPHRAPTQLEIWVERRRVVRLGSVAAVFVAIGEIVADIGVHGRFVRVPSPAAGCVDFDVFDGVVVEGRQIMIALRGPAIFHRAVPEVDEVARHARHFATNVPVKSLAPGQVVTCMGVVHGVDLDQLVHVAESGSEE